MFATVSQIIYLVISIAMTIYVGRSLHSHGRHFLVDVFHDREVLADSVNHLLIVGFYLVNLGWVLVWTRYGQYPETVMDSISFVTTKLGVAMVLLGGMHFVNLKVFWKIRNSELFPAGPDVTAAARGSQM